MNWTQLTLFLDFLTLPMDSVDIVHGISAHCLDSVNFVNFLSSHFPWTECTFSMDLVMIAMDSV